MYAIVGCKKKANFEGYYFLVLKGTKNNSQYLVGNSDWEELNKIVNTDYYKFHDAIKQHDYLTVKELLKKITWNPSGLKGIRIAAEFGDEKVLDILITKKEQFPLDYFLAELTYSPNKSFYPKIFHLIPKNLKGRYFSHAFTSDYPISILNLYNEVKKEDIDMSSHTQVIASACQKENNSKEMLDILEAKGFSFKEKDQDGANTLHQVSQFGNSKNTKRCIEYLLSKGLNINDVDNKGDTPLHRAASVLNKDLVKFLISKGALETIKNNKGQLPYKSQNY